MTKVMMMIIMTLGHIAHRFQETFDAGVRRIENAMDDCELENSEDEQIPEDVGQSVDGCTEAAASTQKTGAAPTVHLEEFAPPPSADSRSTKSGKGIGSVTRCNSQVSSQNQESAKKKLKAKRGLIDLNPMYEHAEGEMLLALSGEDFICLKEMFEVECKKILQEIEGQSRKLTGLMTTMGQRGGDNNDLDTNPQDMHTKLETMAGKLRTLLAEVRPQSKSEWGNTYDIFNVVFLEQMELDHSYCDLINALKKKNCVLGGHKREQWQAEYWKKRKCMEGHLAGGHTPGLAKMVANTASPPPPKHISKRVACFIDSIGFDIE